jgi:hypothetical protein
MSLSPSPRKRPERSIEASGASSARKYRKFGKAQPRPRASPWSRPATSVDEPFSHNQDPKRSFAKTARFEKTRAVVKWRTWFRPSVSR